MSWALVPSMVNNLVMSAKLTAAMVFEPSEHSYSDGMSWSAGTHSDIGIQ